MQPEEPKEVEPATAEVQASRLKIAKNTWMVNFRDWEETMADAIAAKDVELQRLNEEKAKLLEHAKKIREQHAVELTELQGRISTLNLIEKTSVNTDKLAGLDRDVLTSLWDRNDNIKTKFSVDQQTLFGRIVHTFDGRSGSVDEPEGGATNESWGCGVRVPTRLRLQEGKS